MMVYQKTILIIQQEQLHKDTDSTAAVSNSNISTSESSSNTRN